MVLEKSEGIQMIQEMIDWLKNHRRIDIAEELKKHREENYKLKIENKKAITFSPKDPMDIDEIWNIPKNLDN
jgi:hypothetical protein